MKSMTIERKVKIMLKKRNWIWSNDLEYLDSIAKQIKYGRKLSDRQIITIKEIYVRFMETQKPRFVRGGLPGLKK